MQQLQTPKGLLSLRVLQKRLKLEEILYMAAYWKYEANNSSMGTDGRNCGCTKR